MRNNSSSSYSKSLYVPTDNPHILQFKHPILDSHNIDISNLKDKPLDILHLKNLLSEVSCVLKYNNINMYLEKLGCCGEKIDSNSFCWSFKI